MKSLHTQVEATIEVLVARVYSTMPKLLSFFFMTIKICNASLFVEHVGSLANEWNLHPIIFVKVLFVVLNKKFSDF